MSRPSSLRINPPAVALCQLLRLVLALLLQELLAKAIDLFQNLLFGVALRLHAILQLNTLQLYTALLIVRQQLRIGRSRKPRVKNGIRTEYLLRERGRGRGREEEREKRVRNVFKLFFFAA